MVRSRGGSSQGGSSRDKGKAPMVEEEPQERVGFPPLNEYQEEHRTYPLSQPDNEKAMAVKALRYRQHVELEVKWDDRFEPYLRRASLVQTTRIGHIPINGLLISALQERWRKETHTFQMPHGEMTITLEDVLCLMGLRVDGVALCMRNDGITWVDKAEELLGKRPPVEMFRGKAPKKSNILVLKKWFKENFNDLGREEPVERIEQYCRAYLIALFTDILFTDANGDSYSLMPLVYLENLNRLNEWSFGSGVLAYLYREMCKCTKLDRKNMRGCPLLLQLWTWQYFAIGRPEKPLSAERLKTFDDPSLNDTVGVLWAGVTRNDFGEVQTNFWANRDQFDSLPAKYVNWTPYDRYREKLSPICNAERTIARLKLPLIYFWIVERYRPDRVRRQFGYRQLIHVSVPVEEKEAEAGWHKQINNRGDNWPRVHEIHISRWNSRNRRHLDDNTEPFHPNDIELRCFMGRSN